MKITAALLGSASLSLAAILSPCAAQDYPSTPAERAQTQQLNEQAAGGIDNPRTAQTDQYQDQQEQYQQQQQRYQNQQQRYHQQRAQYRADIRQYDLTRYEWADYPRVYVYRYEGPRLKQLYLIADPTHQLAQIPVEGPSGRFIGKVRNVETAPNGAPHRVEIALNRVVSVWVSPGHFRYDPDNRVLFTDLTRDDLWSMPGATVESGTYAP